MIHAGRFWDRLERFASLAIAVDDEEGLLFPPSQELAELGVLNVLADLTAACGPWDAARTLFNPINEEATDVA